MWTTLTFKTALDSKLWIQANTEIKTWYKYFDSTGKITIEYFQPYKLKTI
jgi:hypothetical protein